MDNLYLFSRHLDFLSQLEKGASIEFSLYVSRFSVFLRRKIHRDDSRRMMGGFLSAFQRSTDFSFVSQRNYALDEDLQMKLDSVYFSSKEKDNRSGFYPEGFIKGLLVSQIYSIEGIVQFGAACTEEDTRIYQSIETCIKEHHYSKGFF